MEKSHECDYFIQFIEKLRLKITRKFDEYVKIYDPHKVNLFMDILSAHTISKGYVSKFRRTHMLQRSKIKYDVPVIIPNIHVSIKRKTDTILDTILYEYRNTPDINFDDTNKILRRDYIEFIDNRDKNLKFIDDILDFTQITDDEIIMRKYMFENFIIFIRILSEFVNLILYSINLFLIVDLQYPISLEIFGTECSFLEYPFINNFLVILIFFILT